MRFVTIGCVLLVSVWTLTADVGDRPSEDQASDLADAAAEAPDPARVEAGARLYEIYCRGCHGDDARGGKAGAPDEVAPPDLTRIEARNGGSFPRAKVHGTIDGRGEVAAHGTRSMPVWGLGLQQLDRDSDQEGEVATKIELLVDYLRSIQRTD